MTSSLSHHTQDRCFAAVVPAAGVGKRMLANHPKQYLMLHGKTILEHTIERLLSHPLIDLVIVAISGEKILKAVKEICAPCTITQIKIARNQRHFP